MASKDHAVSDALAFILGIERRADPAHTAFTIDQSLSDDPGVRCYLVADPTHHSAVKVTYHKWRRMPDPPRTRLRRIEERAERGRDRGKQLESDGPSLVRC